MYAKILTVSTSKFRMKAMSDSEISLIPAVFCKLKLLHENEIAQYLQNYKYKDVNQGHFKNTLTSFYKNHNKQLP